MNDRKDTEGCPKLDMDELCECGERLGAHISDSTLFQEYRPGYCPNARFRSKSTVATFDARLEADKAQQAAIRKWLNSDDVCGVSFVPEGGDLNDRDTWCGLCEEHDGPHKDVQDVFGVRYTHNA